MTAQTQLPNTDRWLLFGRIVYYATRAYSIALRTSGKRRARGAVEAGDECAPIARLRKEVRPSCIRYFTQFCV